MVAGRRALADSGSDCPDSDEIGVRGRQDESLGHMIRRSPELDYRDGERP